MQRNQQWTPQGQKTQMQRFYHQELDELDNIKDTLRAKHRREDERSSESDDDSLSDGDHDLYTRNPRQGPIGYVDQTKVEAADMDTHIPENNVGYKLLLKMGWKAGTGLGQNATGRTTPIPIEQKANVMGIGKQEVDTWYNEVSTLKRKALEAEIQAEETQERKEQRE
ncbi:G patch domain-containing protein 8, partial [Podila epigama]